MSEDLQTDLINEYFAAGWRVAPFRKTSDGYLGVKAWPKRAAKNQAELHLLLGEQAAKSTRQPVLGIVPPPGRYVVDIDLKNNPGALDLWRSKVQEATGDLSLATPNMIVKTKSGGYHLYYSDGSDRQIHSPISVFGKDSGIDVRGFTGMVIAPTSLGTVADWQAGEYTVIKGRPSDPLTVLQIAKVIGDSYNDVDHFVRGLLTTINECLRTDTVGELHRHKLLPDALVIPASNRDNLLYRAARLCRLAGVSQDAALVFMQNLASRCEASAEEPLEHWINLGSDKVRRVYADEKEMRLKTVSALYEELDNAGTVLLREVGKAFYYFRHGSKLLRIEPRSMFSTENIGNVLQGVNIVGEEETVPAKKVVATYSPKDVAANAAFYPKKDYPYFEFEGKRFVNTYHDPFATFEPNRDYFEQAQPYVERFAQLVQHITGHEDGDDVRLLDKLAWMLQKPYRKLPTGTIIYSHTRGSGKDVFMSLVREFVGRQYYMPISLDSIESKHTNFHEKIVCVASEVQLQANARGNIAAASFMGKIKDKITAKNVTVEPKFQMPFTAPSFTNYWILSNFELSPILEPGDRRWDIFHATEEKLDQGRFGELADVGNDGVWLDKPVKQYELRKHIIYAIRQSLIERPVDQHFDRSEAVMNEVKSSLMEHQNPPAMDWMYHTLPTYFTEDVAQVACLFCPMKAHPEFIMKQLREHFGPKMQHLYRTGKLTYRLNGAPKLELRSEGTAHVPVLNFDVKTSDTSCRKPVFTFGKTPRDVSPTDAELRRDIMQWYNTMRSRYAGATTNLPGQKPSTGSELI